MSDNGIRKRAYYDIQVTLTSPLNIGNGISLNTDADVMQDGQGRYFIPGSSLAGAFRNYLTEPEHPSLLHGDLWGGNFVTGPEGYACLIDPAVYVGNAEADLAMTELFGGFSTEFYDAYREAGGILPGYSDRRDPVLGKQKHKTYRKYEEKTYEKNYSDNGGALSCARSTE